MHALVKQEISLLAIHYRQKGFQFKALGKGQLAQDDVLRELNTDDISFRMVFDGGHGGNAMAEATQGAGVVLKIDRGQWRNLNGFL